MALQNRALVALKVEIRMRHFQRRIYVWLQARGSNRKDIWALSEEWTCVENVWKTM